LTWPKIGSMMCCRFLARRMSRTLLKFGDGPIAF
jgi:hypothetical protein